MKENYKLRIHIMITILIGIIALFLQISCSDENSSTEPQQIYPTYKIIKPNDRDSILKGTIIEIVFDGYTESYGEFSTTEFYIDSSKIITLIDTPYNVNWNTEYIPIGSKKISTKAFVENEIYFDSISIELFVNEVSNKITYPLDNSYFEKGITIPIEFDCFNDLSTQFPITEFFINDIKIQTITDTPYVSLWNTRAFDFGEHELKVVSIKDSEFFRDSINITLNNQPPIALFEISYSDTGNISTSFIFDAYQSYDGGDPNSVLEVRWDFDGDSIWDTEWSTNKSEVYSFSHISNYNSKLEVRDTGGLTDTSINIVYVLNSAPIGYLLDISTPAGNDQLFFEFTADSLIDLEDNAVDLEVRWDFDGDDIWDTEWTLEKSYEYQFGISGIFEYKYQIRDREGLIGSGAFDTVYVSTSDIDQSEMISVSSGLFTMGIDYISSSSPLHNVSLTNDFEIGKYPITNEQYCEMLNYAYDEGELEIEISSSNVLAVNGQSNILLKYSYPTCEIDWDSTNSNFIVEDGKEIFPARAITWYGAAFYCNILSRMQGLEELYDLSVDEWECQTYNGNEGYRLPTESEWEYTARFDDGRDFPWGNIIGTSLNHNIYTTGGFNSTAVGSYSFTGANKIGVLDLIGNIAEWCNDFYGDYSGEDQTNPTGAENGSSKVIRGMERENLFHNGVRKGKGMSTIKNYLGFRIVKI